MYNKAIILIFLLNAHLISQSQISNFDLVFTEVSECCKMNLENYKAFSSEVVSISNNDAIGFLINEKIKEFTSVPGPADSCLKKVSIVFLNREAALKGYRFFVYSPDIFIFNGRMEKEFIALPYNKRMCESKHEYQILYENLMIGKCLREQEK